MTVLYARDYKCCKCRKRQAVEFWPCIDPDIKSYPYCRQCLDEVQMELLIKIYEPDSEPKKARNSKNKERGIEKKLKGD